MFFSIIIPVFNGERYLEECIDSILGQSFSDFELILVNDGSTDNSGKICDIYSQKDSRVSVIHKKNGGAGSAWQKGLEYVRGIYVGSIDCDDYIESDFLFQLNKKIKESSCDMIVYGYRNFEADGNQIFKINLPEGLYDRTLIESKIFPILINRGTFENRNAFYLSRVNKFIKKELLLQNKKYYTEKISYGEDDIWTIPNVLSASRIYVMSNYYPYFYRNNAQSKTHRYNPDLWVEFKQLANDVLWILNDFQMNDLKIQVYRNSVFLAAVAINNIFFGALTPNKAKKEISFIINDEYVKKGISHMDLSECSLKERINIFLIKYKMKNLIYRIKTIQKRKRRKFESKENA